MSESGLRWYVAGCCILIAAAQIACNDDPEPEEPGVLSLTWRVSPLGCKESGVETVAIELSNNTRSTVGCEVGRAVVENLDPGAYQFNLLGLDADGKAIFESGPLDAGIDSGQVTNMDDVRLTARAGTLDVSWHFDNGRLCAANGVQEVLVAVYDTDAFAMGESLAACEDSVTTITGLKSGLFVVEVIATGADGIDLFRGVEELSIDRGDALSIDVTLEPCEQGCGS
ncbi:MAG: hypothetical protein CMH57_09700 [Myxococcales bacterium]|nr:hypothetical protein [Myxococcales bacterium]